MVRLHDFSAVMDAKTQSFFQWRPVNFKYDARCVMGKVGGRQKNPKGGNFNLLL